MQFPQQGRMLNELPISILKNRSATAFHDGFLVRLYVGGRVVSQIVQVPDGRGEQHERCSQDRDY